MTGYFILAVIILIAVYDVYIIAKKGKRDSISAYIIRASRKYVIVPLAAGFLLGHIFWSMNTEDIYNVECNEVSNVKSKE